MNSANPAAWSKACAPNNSGRDKKNVVPAHRLRIIFQSMAKYLGHRYYAWEPSAATAIQVYTRDPEFQVKSKFEFWITSKRRVGCEILTAYLRLNGNENAFQGQKMIPPPKS